MPTTTQSTGRNRRKVMVQPMKKKREQLTEESERDEILEYKLQRIDWVLDELARIKAQDFKICLTSRN